MLVECSVLGFWVQGLGVGAKGFRSGFRTISGLGALSSGLQLLLLLGGEITRTIQNFLLLTRAQINARSPEPYSPPQVDRIWGILLGLYRDNEKENGND